MGRFEHCSMSSLSAPSGVSLTVEPQSGLGLNLGPEEAVGLALWVGRGGERGPGGGEGFWPEGRGCWLGIEFTLSAIHHKKSKKFP